MKLYKALVGLGNPGPQFTRTRHNIGFDVLNALVDQHNESWRTSSDMEYATISLNGSRVLCVKPQTFMNNSGKAVPFLAKKGIKLDEVIVLHDELELAFGKCAFKEGGSPKGHNGLRSLIAQGGEAFTRLRVGIGRPADKSDVGNYVLARFSEKHDEVDALIATALHMLEEKLST